jgi:hypothetical protein
MSRITLVAACAASFVMTTTPASAAFLDAHPRTTPATKRKPLPRVALPAVLQRIALCESGGDPRAISSGGDYRGKYQFDRGTWAAMGGSGDPAAASEREQDARAVALLARAGTSPWPVCGG